VDTGQAWIVDAHGCEPEALRSVAALQALVARVMDELELHAVQPPAWHAFPPPGGVTGFVLLRESHLAVHTFPEHGFAAIDLYCCRALPEWPWDAALAEALGAAAVEVRTVARGAARPHRAEVPR
jgi:S-adenosylmethionine decarboxylase